MFCHDGPLLALRAGMRAQVIKEGRFYRRQPGSVAVSSQIANADFLNGSAERGYIQMESINLLAMLTASWVVIGVVVFVILFLITAYNGLVSARNRVRNAFSQIDVQLKRRYDLIPNLVETVKGYAAHESRTLENVVKARQRCIDTSGVANQAAAENMLTGALRQLFALSESYPDLKANQNFSQLSEELTSTENKIGFARQHYNNTVENYNTRLQKFPTLLVANAFGFQPEEFFELDDDAAREPVKVQF